jgi:hypothetical protein
MIELLPVLQAKGLIEQADVARIANELRTSGRSFEDIMHDIGVPVEEILKAKGEHWNVPVRVRAPEAVPYEVLNLVPEESAKHYHVVPIGLIDGVLEVGVVDPDNIDALDALNFISTKEGVPFKIFLITQTSYKRIYTY